MYMYSHATMWLCLLFSRTPKPTDSESDLKRVRHHSALSDFNFGSGATGVGGKIRSRPYARQASDKLSPRSARRIKAGVPPPPPAPSSSKATFSEC